jgi:alkylhydroperoxidase family enzyme
VSRLSLTEVPEELPIKNNLVRALYHNPDLYKDFGRLAMRVHSASHLTRRVRELTVLRVTSRLGADYEWGNHVAVAKDAEITDEEIRAVRDGELSRFDGQDLMAIRLADAIETTSVDDAMWNEARELFSEVELLDLVVVAAFYGLASRCVLAWSVPLDEGVRGLDHP